MIKKYIKDSLMYQFDQVKGSVLKIEIKAKESKRDLKQGELSQIRKSISTMCEIAKTLLG